MKKLITFLFLLTQITCAQTKEDLLGEWVTYSLEDGKETLIIKFQKEHYFLERNYETSKEIIKESANGSWEIKEGIINFLPKEATFGNEKKEIKNLIIKRRLTTSSKRPITSFITTDKENKSRRIWKNILKTTKNLKNNNEPRITKP